MEQHKPLDFARGKRAQRWRGSLKSVLANAISRAHDQGFAQALARGTARPLVLGYHRVVEDYASASQIEMPSMLISTEMFERHLDCVGRHFTFVGVDEIGERIAEGRPFERPVAAVTFDDGYRDVYENALPILKRKGIPATMFVVTDLVSTPRWQVHDKLYYLIAKGFAMWEDPRRELSILLRALNLPAEELTGPKWATKSPTLAVSALLPSLPQGDVFRLIDSLEASVGNGFHHIPPTLGWYELLQMRRNGFTIGSHTRSHVSLPMESPDVIADELVTSKHHLEAGLGEPVKHFAYPGGQFNAAVVEAVARAGYDYAYTACQHGEQEYPALTIERLLLWEGSSVDQDGRFSPAILNCQAQDLWPPSRQCGRVHDERAAAHG